MAFFDRLRENRWRDRVARELAGNPAWNQFLFSKTWLCPYCGRAVLDNAKDNPELAAKVLEHLKSCPDWKEFNGSEKPAAELASSIRKTEVAHHLKTNPVWRLRDSGGNWYCPYCARQTEIVFESNRLTKETLDAIIRHVDECFAYDRGQGQVQPLQYVQTTLENADRIKRLTGTVAERVASDPLWRFKNASQHWACPYCKRIIESVDMASEFLTSTVAPREIAKHMVESCPAYQDGKGRLASVDELEAVTSTGSSPSASGTFSAVVSRPTGQTDSAMFEAIRQELDQVRQAMSRSQEADEQQKELMRSIEKAGQQQRMMLPDLPQVPGMDFEVLYRPMATVSGDFYDFFKVSDSQIGLVIGDVSGHGVEAALVMSMVKKSIKIHGRGMASAAEVLRVTNADIYEDLGQNTFASVFYGVLDTETRNLRFSRAGHSPLILFNTARKPDLYTLEPKGIALGIDKGPAFNRALEEMELQLAAGDMLVQFTDGVAEANNRRKEEFGIERICETVRKHGTHEARYLAHMIELEVQEFRAGVPAEDDVTVMCIKIS